MQIPYILILLRFIFAPLIFFLAFTFGDNSRHLILTLIFLGLLSDIFDGIIARKQNISTVKLRRLDSQVDLIFWLSVGISCYFLNPEIINENKIGVMSVFILEFFCYLTSFIKFGKETCTHAILSKIWGLLLFSTFVSIIGFKYGGIILHLALLWGIISQIDVILIILILPKWQNDIPTCYHSYLIRKGIPFKKNKYLNS